MSHETTIGNAFYPPTENTYVLPQWRKGGKGEEEKNIFLHLINYYKGEVLEFHNV